MTESRHAQAQREFRAAKALPAAEQKAALRTWRARFPEYEDCGCSGQRVRLKRRGQ